MCSIIVFLLLAFCFLLLASCFLLLAFMLCNDCSQLTIEYSLPTRPFVCRATFTKVEKAQAFLQPARLVSLLTEFMLHVVNRGSLFKDTHSAPILPDFLLFFSSAYMTSRQLFGSCRLPPLFRVSAPT